MISEYKHIWTTEKNDWVLIGTSVGHAIFNAKTRMALIIEDDTDYVGVIEEMKKANVRIVNDIKDV